MNNKGFMMAEVVVVSSIILVALAAFYASYNKIISIYNQRVDYYDVATLYDLAYIRDVYETELAGIGSTGAVINEQDRKVYYLDITEITDMIGGSLNPTFDDYLKFLSTSIQVDTDNILVMEKCDTDGKSNCKYAYLEVY